MIAASSGSGGASSDPPAQAPGKGLGGNISGPREGKYRSPLPLRDLSNDMGGGAKAVEPQFLAGAGDHERSPADQASAEQGSQRHVIASFAERERIAGIGDGCRGEAAVAGIPGEERAIAKVFLVTPAIGTDATGVAEPRNADALTHVQLVDARPDHIDLADDLVARDDRHLRIGQFAIDNMQVRAADAAGGNLDSNLTGPRLPIGKIGPFQPFAQLVQHHRFHSILRFPMLSCFVYCP